MSRSRRSQTDVSEWECCLQVCTNALASQGTPAVTFTALLWKGPRQAGGWDPAQGPCRQAAGLEGPGEEESRAHVPQPHLAPGHPQSSSPERCETSVLEGDHSRGLRPSHEPNVAIATHHICRTRRGPCGAVASPRHFSSSLGGPGGEGSRDLGSGPAAAVLPPCFWHVPPQATRFVFAAGLSPGTPAAACSPHCPCAPRRSRAAPQLSPACPGEAPGEQARGAAASRQYLRPCALLTSRCQASRCKSEDFPSAALPLPDRSSRLCLSFLTSSLPFSLPLLRS